MREAKAIRNAATDRLRWNTQSLKWWCRIGLFAFFSFLSVTAQAQLQVDRVAPAFPVFTFPTLMQLPLVQPFRNTFPEKSVLMRPQPIPRFRHEAFFCKLEDRWLANNHFPLRFRLGSVPYVDALEGK